MKLYLTTNADLNLTELAEFNIEYTLLKVNDRIRTKYNPYHASMWADFDFVRAFAPKKGYDARGFLTTADELKSVGITGHLGMYDMVDNDGILDFYAGVPTRLDKRAKLNGFKTNEAWLVVHELCHGLCQKQGKRDVAHVMEEQGRLKELWNELHNEELKTKVSLLQEILRLATIVFNLKKKSIN